MRAALARALSSANRESLTASPDCVVWTSGLATRLTAPAVAFPEDNLAVPLIPAPPAFRERLTPADGGPLRPLNMHGPEPRSKGGAPPGAVSEPHLRQQGSSRLAKTLN